MSVLILIPARLASTRLPGKPLADIGGRADDRARRRTGGRVGPRPGGRGDRYARDRRGRRAPHGFECVMTRADHGSGSDRIHEALGRDRSRRRVRHDRQPPGRPADDRSRDDRARARAAGRPGLRHRDPRRRDHRRGRAHQSERREARRHAGRARPPARALLHPRHRALGRGAALSIMSASTPIAAPRWSASSRCRPRRWRCASGWSSCARSKPA